VSGRRSGRISQAVLIALRPWCRTRSCYQQPAREAVDHCRQIQEVAVAHRQVGDVADVLGVRCARGEVAPEQVRYGVADGSGTVVVTRLRSRSPAMPNFRITRPTRLWFTRSPSSRSSGVIRERP